MSGVFFKNRNFSLLLFLFIFLPPGCLYHNRLIKEYSLGKNYKVTSGDVMLEFKYAKVRNLESNIDHVVELKEEQKIIFRNIEGENIFLEHIIEFQDSKYSGEKKDVKFRLNKFPDSIMVNGFEIKLNGYSNESLSYQIMTEPEGFDSTGSVLNIYRPVTGTEKKDKGLKY